MDSVREYFRKALLYIVVFLCKYRFLVAPLMFLSERFSFFGKILETILLYVVAEYKIETPYFIPNSDSRYFSWATSQQKHESIAEKLSDAEIENLFVRDQFIPNQGNRNMFMPFIGSFFTSIALHTSNNPVENGWPKRRSSDLLGMQYLYGLTEEEKYNHRTKENGKITVPSKENSYKTAIDNDNFHNLKRLDVLIFVILFSKNHNRICDILKSENESLIDTDIYEIAMSYNWLTLIKLILQQYSAAALGIPSDFLPQRPEVAYEFPYSLFTKEYTSALSVKHLSYESVILYLWHSTMFSQIKVKGKNVTIDNLVSNRGDPLLDFQIEDWFVALNDTIAGEYTLKNTPASLVPPIVKVNQKLNQFNAHSLKKYEEVANINLDYDEMSKIYQELKAKMKTDVKNLNLLVASLIPTNRITSSFLNPLMITFVLYPAYQSAISNKLLEKAVKYDSPKMKMETDSVILDKLIKDNFPKLKNSQTYFSFHKDRTITVTDEVKNTVI
jgi:hypothetical protein